jgi:hypothetical protein
VGTTTSATITEFSIAQTAKKVPVSKTTKTPKTPKKVPVSKTTKTPKTKNPINNKDPLDQSELDEYRKNCINNKNKITIASLSELNKKLKLLKFPTQNEWSLLHPFVINWNYNPVSKNDEASSDVVYYFNINTLQEVNSLNVYFAQNVFYRDRLLGNVLKKLILDLKTIRNTHNYIDYKPYNIIVGSDNQIRDHVLGSLNTARHFEPNFPIVIRFDLCQENTKRMKSFVMKIAIFNYNTISRFTDLTEAYFEPKQYLDYYGGN